jgi:hypothetical protein
MATGHTSALVAIALFGGVFTFLAVAVWSGNRTRERELYYRSELLKKALDTPGPEGAAVLAHLKDEEAEQARARAAEKQTGLLIGGLSVTAVGIGLMIFMRSIGGPAREYFLVGLIPLLVGIALLIGSRMAKESDARPS